MTEESYPVIKGKYKGNCGRELGDNPYWNTIGFCSRSCFLQKKREEKKQSRN